MLETRPTLLSHRGRLDGYFADTDGIAAYPTLDNSLATLRAAFQHGFGVELDVRLWKNALGHAKMVLMHDDDRDDAGYLRLLEARSRFKALAHPSDLGLADFPAFLTVLSALDLHRKNSGVVVNIELKDLDCAALLAEQLADWINRTPAWNTAQFIVSSFLPAALQHFSAAVQRNVPIFLLLDSVFRAPPSDAVSADTLRHSRLNAAKSSVIAQGWQGLVLHVDYLTFLCEHDRFDVDMAAFLSTHRLGIYTVNRDHPILAKGSTWLEKVDILISDTPMAMRTWIEENSI